MDKNKMRTMVDRDAPEQNQVERIEALEAKCALLAASLKQSDSLVASAQVILAQHHEPVGPSKADTIKALTELLSDSTAIVAPADPIAALMARIDDVWVHEERMNKALADVRRMLAAIEAEKGGAA